MRIAVFCTGGTDLGFGHFFRSKTFARSAPESCTVRIFPVVAGEDRHFFTEISGITTPCAHEEEAVNEILKFKPDILVFDAVFCSAEMISALRPAVRLLASISPVFNQMRAVDLLFTRNKDANDIDGVQVYKGMQYAIFNENCTFISDEGYFYNLSKPMMPIGISMGGGDAPNKTLNVLKVLAGLPAPCTFWVLLGEGYRHSYQHLVDAIHKESNHEIILAKTNRSMWHVLSNCCMGILAGGLTTIEAVYAGLPTLNIFDKKEHLEATGIEFFTRGAAECIGIFGKDSLAQLGSRVAELYAQKSQLVQMRERSKGQVDRLGPQRIYDILLKERD